MHPARDRRHRQQRHRQPQQWPRPLRSRAISSAPSAPTAMNEATRVTPEQDGERQRRPDTAGYAPAGVATVRQQRQCGRNRGTGRLHLRTPPHPGRRRTAGASSAVRPQSAPPRPPRRPGGPINRRYVPPCAINAACVPGFHHPAHASSTRMRSAPDHAAQSMRQDDGGATLHQPVQRLPGSPPRSPHPRHDSASSRIRIGASRNSARAMASRCRCPPDSRSAALPHQRVVLLRQRQDERHPPARPRAACCICASRRVRPVPAAGSRRWCRGTARCPAPPARSALRTASGVQRPHDRARRGAPHLRLRVGLAQQQPHDARLAGAAGPHHPDPLPRGDPRNLSPRCAGRRAPG